MPDTYPQNRFRRFFRIAQVVLRLVLLAIKVIQAILDLMK